MTYFWSETILRNQEVKVNQMILVNKAVNIDLANFFLIVVSFLVSLFFPYETFILAYSILGPLHYLTETNWLKNKGDEYNKWFIPVILFSLLIVVPKWFLESQLPINSGIMSLSNSVNELSNVFIFLPLIFSWFLFYGKSKLKIILIAILCFIVGLVLNLSPLFITTFGLLVPTIIHVYVFTILFMVSGTIRNQDKIGIVNILLMLIAPLIIWLLPRIGTDYRVPENMKLIFTDSHFHYTNVLFSKFLGLSDGKSFFFYEQLELKIQRFISFAYLYHYLNWFSKTNVIYWHKAINKKTAIVIGLLWILLLILFWFNYRLGFLVALFFSFVHLLMEFPLNVSNIKFIANSMRKALQ